MAAPLSSLAGGLQSWPIPPSISMVNARFRSSFSLKDSCGFYPGKTLEHGSKNSFIPLAKTGTGVRWMPPPRCGAGHLTGPQASVAVPGGWLQTLSLLHQIILRDHLFMSSKRTLFATMASCCEELIVRCLCCSQVDDCIVSSLEVTSYKFFWTKAPTFSKLPARPRGICINRFVYSQPSVFVSGDPTKFFS